MVLPTIRCAHPTCDCVVPMGTALRVGTQLYCSLGCANGVGNCGHHTSGNCAAAPHDTVESAPVELRSKAS